ncbi:TetR/AcrR family transcriptional regulator [Paracoccus fistulariae]|uniref:TetR/AcrR family transcriptional regulator n=1 Tax=Paracoccus fistulariae TaxID=658446 RepID=A0ABY7SMH1_9RHOB|nr:TetR/AcrR family transcriptional regulator [Paracoccus fistulariae]MDB6182552.1 TetR/AcrR family transcriptional regulator [Paracoccus fistulariae]WCR07763.1 TetR/AcrR family transcriptional regulator [Paracoccus fistulariae]
MPTVLTRRYRTAKKIQQTAVQLAIRDGLAHTTTEAIAREAGISTRSFFNYYPYKEAAIMGPSPGYPRDASEKFVISRGPLIEDLKAMIFAHFRRFENERELIGHVLTLAENDPKLEALRSTSVLASRTEMCDLLRRRLPPGHEVQVELLSSSIIAATNLAMRHWAHHVVEDFVTTVDGYLDMIGPSSELLEEPCTATL